MTIDEKFSNALAIIQSVTPQYAYFYDLFSRKSTKDKDVTIRTNMLDDYHAMLEYNEEYVSDISAQTLAALVCIELNRLLLRHSTKRRMPDPKLHYKASNIVTADPSICDILEYDADTVKLKNELPNDKNPKIRAELPSTYNHDTDCSLEVLYEMLKPNNKNQQHGPSSSNGNGQGQGQSQGKGNGNGQRQGNGKQPPMSQQTKKELDRINQHFDPNHADKQTEKWGENSLADAEITKRVNDADPTVWGNMPGDLREKIKAANVKVVDPRKALGKFIATAYSNKFTGTRMKPNRRCPEDVGKIPGKRHEQEFKLGIFADASGSMSEYDLKLCMQCINQFVRTGAQVEYGWWDCTCEKPTKILRPHTEADCYGGGGTDPQCILEMMHKNKLKYDGIIVLTDCGFSWPKPKEHRNIFIIRTPEAIEAPEWLPASRQMSMKDVKEYIEKYER